MSSGVPRRRPGKKVHREALQRLTVLSVLPEAALDELMTSASVAGYERREAINWQRQDEGVVLGVIGGLVDICFLSAEGKELPVLGASTGQVVDLGTDGWAGTDATMVTVRSEHAIIGLLCHGAFERAITSSVAAMRLLLVEQGRWLRELGGLASDRLHLNPDVRIRHVIWRDSRSASEDGMSYVQTHLAARAGTDQPRASKEIQRLCRDGVIEVHRKEHRMVVLNPDRLVED